MINQVMIGYLFVLGMVGIVMSLVPYMTEKSLIFGVRVPIEHVKDNSILRYRALFTVSVLLVTLVLVLLGFVLFNSHEVVVTLFPLLIIAFSFAVYLKIHYGIEGTKKMENWVYASADKTTINFIPDSYKSFPWIYIVPGISLIVTIFIIGLADYSFIPARFPTHFGLNGPNQFATKTYFTVFTIGLIAIIINVFLYLFSFFIYRIPLKITNSDSSQKMRADAFRTRIAIMIALTPLFVNTTMLISALYEWNIIPYSNDSLSLILAPIIALLVLLGYIMMRTGQMGSNLNLGAESANAKGDAIPSGSGIKDDDSLWRAGIIYVNKNDNRLLVPKRFGVGYTFNFGKKISFVLLALILLIPVTIIFIVLLFH